MNARQFAIKEGDAQRPAIYQAEDETSWWKQGNHLNITEISALVVDISDWAGIDAPQICADDKTHVARGHIDHLDLPPFARNVSYICHEMTHTIARQLKTDDAHGPLFARSLLEVVNQFIGPKEAKELRSRFRAHGIKIARRSARQRVPA